jgi:hypothetical protein
MPIEDDAMTNIPGINTVQLDMSNVSNDLGHPLKTILSRQIAVDRQVVYAKILSKYLYWIPEYSRMLFRLLLAPLLDERRIEGKPEAKERNI